MNETRARHNSLPLSRSESSKQAARVELRERLQDIEFLAFEQLMKSLLYKSGYLSVHLIGRNHKRGRTPKGGLDLTARSVTELSSSLTIAQVKQYRRVVSRRFVDELRGAMLRLGAEQGLLLTTSRFSRVAHEAAEDSNVAPITLIEGDGVLDLLFAYRIGVVECKGEWQIDRAYLDSLQKKAMGTYRGGSDNKSGITTQTRQSKTQRHAHEPPSPTATSHPSNQPSHDLQPTTSPTELRPSALPVLPGGEMTWSTHLMAGLSALWLMEALPTSQPENMALLAGAAALGSLLPDLDAAESKIKHLSIAGIKPFLLPSQMIYGQLGHRSFLHSLPGLTFCGCISLLLLPFVGWQIALALWLGYASHLATDAMTRSGIPWLYPHRERFHLLPPRLRITTGSPEEEIIFVLLSLFALLLTLRHLPVQ
jgi:inner membrane protein